MKLAMPYFFVLSLTTALFHFDGSSWPAPLSSPSSDSTQTLWPLGAQPGPIQVPVSNVGTKAGPTGAVAAPAAERLTDKFELAVPFRTQMDDSRFEASNCGPASLGMVLQAYGISQRTPDLRWRSHTYQGTTGEDAGTALEFLAQVGKDFGLTPVGLYDRKDFHQWTTAEIRDQLTQGHPVVVLAHYRHLPDHEASPYMMDHYVVLYGVDGNGFRFHDPVFQTAEEGSGRWISAAQLSAALEWALVPYQAVAFEAGHQTPLAIAPIR